MARIGRQVPAVAIGLALLLATSDCAARTSPSSSASVTATRIAPTVDGTTRLAVIGDFGSGNANEDAVARSVRARAQTVPFAALVTTGDNIYPDGSPEHYDRAWRDPYGWTTTAGLPIVASLGNHDSDSGHAGDVRGILGMPGAWYTRQVGLVQLIVLDANAVSDADQNRFLRSTLTSPMPTGARYRVVVFHQPAYSCAKHQSTPEIIQRWVPLFQHGQVALVLNGHDHVYERFQTGSVTYVVTGGGGQDLYTIGTCPTGTPQPVVAVEAFHYVEIDATPAALRLTAVSPDGRQLDHVTISG